MYDFPEVRAATDAWWRGIAAALRGAGIEAVPATLNRGADHELWHSPELLLSQTCGYPLTHALAGVVELVATPTYAAGGCSGADYCSLVVIAEDNPATELADTRGAVCVISRRDSHSGYNALRAALAPLAGKDGYFSQVLESGGHAASIALVAAGKADVCAVDCVTHALLARYQPHALAGTRVMATTERAPGLPYVTRAGVADDYLRRMRDGLSEAFANPHLGDVREALLLTGMQVLGYEVYRRIDDMENAARAAGFAQIQ